MPFQLGRSTSSGSELEPSQAPFGELPVTASHPDLDIDAEKVGPNTGNN